MGRIKNDEEKARHLFACNDRVVTKLFYKMVESNIRCKNKFTVRVYHYQLYPFLFNRTQTPSAMEIYNG